MPAGMSRPASQCVMPCQGAGLRSSSKQWQRPWQHYRSRPRCPKCPKGPECPKCPSRSSIVALWYDGQRGASSNESPSRGGGSLRCRSPSLPLSSLTEGAKDRRQAWQRPFQWPSLPGCWFIPFLASPGFLHLNPWTAIESGRSVRQADPHHDCNDCKPWTHPHAFDAQRPLRRSHRIFKSRNLLARTGHQPRPAGQARMIPQAVSAPRGRYSLPPACLLRLVIEARTLSRADSSCAAASTMAPSLPSYSRLRPLRPVRPTSCTVQPLASHRLTPAGCWRW